MPGLGIWNSLGRFNLETKVFTVGRNKFKVFKRERAAQPSLWQVFWCSRQVHTPIIIKDEDWINWVQNDVKLLIPSYVSGFNPLQYTVVGYRTRTVFFIPSSPRHNGWLITRGGREFFCAFNCVPGFSLV